MKENEDKRKHLEFIQEVIKRMASNSFLLKGWSITLISAVIGFVIQSNAPEEKSQQIYLILLAIGLIIAFWFLDAFYLSQERAYIKLFEDVRKRRNEDIDFSLNAKPYLSGYASWSTSLTSKIFLIFYVPTLIVLLLICSRLIGVDFYIK